MKKKLLAVVLTVAMVLVLMPGTTFATNTDVTTFNELQTALDGAASGDTITLTQNIRAGDYIGDLTVGNGVTLALSDDMVVADPYSLTVQSGGKVIVQNGGHLIIDDSTLTLNDGASITVDSGGALMANANIAITNGVTVTINGELLVGGFRILSVEAGGQLICNTPVYLDDGETIDVKGVATFNNNLTFSNDNSIIDVSETGELIVNGDLSLPNGLRNLDVNGVARLNGNIIAGGRDALYLFAPNAIIYSGVQMINLINVFELPFSPFVVLAPLELYAADGEFANGVKYAYIPAKQDATNTFLTTGLVPAEIPTRSGYDFSGWSYVQGVDPVTSEPIYATIQNASLNTVLVHNGFTTLTAQWTPTPPPPVPAPTPTPAPAPAVIDPNALSPQTGVYN